MGYCLRFKPAWKGQKSSEGVEVCGGLPKGPSLLFLCRKAAPTWLFLCVMSVRQEKCRTLKEAFLNIVQTSTKLRAVVAEAYLETRNSFDFLLITSFVIANLITSFVIAYLITSFVIAYMFTSFVIAYLIASFFIAYLITSFVTAYIIP